MASFKYLGRLLAATDNNCAEVLANLWKARKKWYMISRILGMEGTYMRMSGNFFKVVLQAVLLFGLNMWVVTHVSAGRWGGSTTGWMAV